MTSNIDEALEPAPTLTSMGLNRLCLGIATDSQQDEAQGLPCGAGSGSFMCWGTRWVLQGDAVTWDSFLPLPSTAVDAVLSPGPFNGAGFIH